MKVFMTGGGTAGHVNPALSIAEIIKKNEPQAVVEFVGTADRLEAQLVPRAGYKLHTIEVYGLKRSLSPKNIKIMYKAYESYAKCKKLMKAEKPDAVIGTGGYVSWPVCRAAAALKIPTFLHEANAQPGFAVKMLDSKADVIFVNFEDTLNYLKAAKTRKIHVGMPIDAQFYTLDKEEARQKVLPSGYKKMVLSFGGSLGAERVNNAVCDMLSEYAVKHPEIYFVHASGKRSYKSTLAKLKENGTDQLKNIKVCEYIYDMPLQMAAADVVISRSGASTMSELAALGKPSILVPSPNVTNNQQYKNAKVFADKEGAILIEDAKCDSKTLADALDSLFSSHEKLLKMSENAKSFAVHGTADIIYKTVREYVNLQNGKA